MALFCRKEGDVTGINFLDFLRPKAKSGRLSKVEITCHELFAAAQEFQIRELCFWICVNMIANAIGRCEFRTFRKNEEIFEEEYFLWNVEPNVNQNSTAFLHKLIAQLCRNNEALIVDFKKPDGREALVVADDWGVPEKHVTIEDRYENVTVDGFGFKKTFPESEVLHLQLNHVNIRPVVNGLYESYYRLIAAAMKNYQWDRGQHWKVHVDQMAQGEEDWTENFQKMITDRVKPFFESNRAILTEFDGCTYENVGGDAKGDTRDIRAMVEDIFDFTARAFLIPAVLVNGTIEGTADANTRFLTNCIDPICDQLQEEITRKRYGYERWRRGEFIRVDSSSILHFDIFENAANVEKLVGSGAYTINDVRRAANQATLKESWADQHFMTLNISTMAQATRQLSTQGGENQ